MAYLQFLNGMHINVTLGSCTFPLTALSVAKPSFAAFLPFPRHEKTLDGESRVLGLLGFGFVFGTLARQEAEEEEAHDDDA